MTNFFPPFKSYQKQTHTHYKTQNKNCHVLYHHILFTVKPLSGINLTYVTMTQRSAHTIEQNCLIGDKAVTFQRKAP